MSSVDLNNFTFLETECMKIITSKSGNYISQFDVYNRIIEKLELKDPIEKDRLKYKVLMILRSLTNIYDNIYILNKNNILYICFSTEEIINEDVKINKKIENDKLNTQKNDMPTDISVINFILDNNVTDFIYQSDYLGNNTLHYLIMNNDLDRIKTNFTKLLILLEKENNKGEFPFDLITDIKISNLFLKTYYFKFQEIDKDLLNIYVKMDDLILKNSDTSIFNRIIMFLLFILYILYIIYDNYDIINNSILNYIEY
jgi:hypothetical protein